MAQAEGGDKGNMGDVDAWIEQLMECKHLSEGQVKQLCEKVGGGHG